ncbi:MAG: prepilin peptidase [Clostridiales bacterium]|nr:prepilin peptidase [Clostridiales bacterium]
MVTIQFLLLLITGFYIIYIDFKERIIPNKVNLILLIGGVVITAVDYKMIVSHIAGFLVLGILMYLLAVITKGFGMGDVKYLFTVGLILGLKQGLTALVIGFILGGVVSLILLLMKKVTLKDFIAFGPYLVVGTLVSFLI